MSSELDTATMTRTRSLVYQLEQGSRSLLMMRHHRLGREGSSRLVSHFSAFHFASPNVSALSSDYPRSRKESLGSVQRDNNGRLYALRVAISMWDRDRCAPWFSAPGRSCAPLTAIICKNYGVRRLVGGRLAEAPSRRSSRRHTIRGESKCRD